MSDITEAAKKNMTGLKTQALDHCAGRLDKDELKKLGDIIDEYAGILDFELEQLVEEKGAAGGTVAMDRAPRSFSSTRSAVQEIQAIDAAMRECAPHLGGRVIAYDSAASVYREALVSMGHKDRLKGVTGAGYQAIYRLAVQPGGAGVSKLAMDKAGSDFNSRFPTAAKIVRGTGRV